MLQSLIDAFFSNEPLLWWLAGSSCLTFVGSLFLVPFLLTRLPADYFAHGKRQRPPWSQHHPLIRGFLLFCKNVLGAFFLLAGFAMLFLPGQGILTMVVGVVLLDLPGKYHMERWLVCHRPILNSINWLRFKANKPQLILGKSVDR